jgi:predicted PurR-regulated permease PerM
MAIQKLVANYKQYLSKLGSVILGLGEMTLNGLIYMLTTLVLVFYLLHDGKSIKNGLVDLVPSSNEASVDRFLNRLHRQFHGIIKGQIFMSFLAGMLLYLVLMTMGVTYALLLGILFGVASILPVIGPWIGLIPIIGIIAFSGHPIDILQVLLITGLFYITKTYWLWPKLLNRSHDVHPILFILAFVICLKLVGFLGLLLSFPLASILSVAFQTLQESHLSQEAQTKLPLR